MLEPKQCCGCGKILDGSRSILFQDNEWCPSCHHIIDVIARETHHLRSKYPAMRERKFLAAGTAAILLGYFTSRPFINRRDYMLIRAAVKAATEHMPIPALGPLANLDEVRAGLNKTSGGRALAAHLLSGFTRRPEPQPEPELVELIQDFVPDEDKDEVSSYHTMKVVKYTATGCPPTVYYQSRCTVCDVYSSKYWNLADCPTRHPEMTYA